jgi:hypothetical protein
MCCVWMTVTGYHVKNIDIGYTAKLRLFIELNRNASLFSIQTHSQ